MWNFPEDTTPAVLTAEQHIKSGHGNDGFRFPKTAVLFYMHGGEKYVQQNYQTKLLAEKFLRFLAACPLYQIQESNELCFLDGGRGAPQAVDTLETLAAFGIQNVVSVGMFGAFGEEIESGDIVIPHKAFVEEGTSLHYYRTIEYATPHSILHQRAINQIEKAKVLPIVSTDAVYRQTFFKENLWRKKGIVGVDMETSALYSVGAYLGVKVVSILIASDKHPMRENSPSWKWTMTEKVRNRFFETCLEFAKSL